MGSLNTQILADVASSREGARYLHRLAEANHDAATAAHKARSTSESGWHGEAAEAFRGYVDRNAKDADELVRVIRNVSEGLDKFADQISTAKSRMQQAHQAAREGGLVVTGWVIHEPTGSPTQAAQKGMGSTDMPGLTPDPPGGGTTKKEQFQAWYDVESLVGWARNLEQTAHEELNGALTDANGIIASLKKPSFWIGNVVAYAGGVHAAATTLASQAEARLAFVEQFKRLAADSALPAETRQARITQMMGTIGLTEKQATSNARALANLGTTKAGNLVFNPLTKTFGGSKPGFFRSLGRMGSVAGFVFTGLNAGKQIVFDGKPVGKTLQVNFEGWGWGAATGGATASILSGFGLAGGPVTAAALGVGSATTWAYGYFQENSWNDFTHDMGETAHDVYEGAEDVARGATEWMTERWGPGATPPMGR